VVGLVGGVDGRVVEQGSEGPAVCVFRGGRVVTVEDRLDFGWVPSPGPQAN
jgi:hypothetical protein